MGVRGGGGSFLLPFPVQLQGFLFLLLLLLHFLTHHTAENNPLLTPCITLVSTSVFRLQHLQNKSFAEILKLPVKGVFHTINLVLDYKLISVKVSMNFLF